MILPTEYISCQYHSSCSKMQIFFWYELHESQKSIKNKYLLTMA
jgi:hypothetical protein